MTSLTAMKVSELSVLAPAVAVGFDKLSYTIDVLDGQIDPPDEMIGLGFDLDYMTSFLARLTQDPLRHKIATGVVPVGCVPVTFENTGEAVVVEDLVLTGDQGLLAWCLSQGVRMGVCFRIPLDSGRCGSLNFYSRHALDPKSLEAALPAVFLAGHRAHELLSERRSLPRALLLSRREMECLQAMARGGSNGQIARDLGLSAETVKEYVRALFRKLNVHNRAEAVSRGHALNYL